MKIATTGNILSAYDYGSSILHRCMNLFNPKTLDFFGRRMPQAAFLVSELYLTVALLHS